MGINASVGSWKTHHDAGWRMLNDTYSVVRSLPDFDTSHYYLRTQTYELERRLCIVNELSNDLIEPSIGSEDIFKGPRETAEFLITKDV